MTIPVVELVDIERTFDATPPVHALKPTSLTIQPGEFVAIVGPSGSGKSTLLHLLGLLDSPSSGSYVLDGVDTQELSERDLAHVRSQKIGFVFQAFHLLATRNTVENVELAELYQSKDHNSRTERSIAALKQVGLGHRLNSFPTTLSGGERQRVAIARALLKQPALILADEPTGNLDTKTSEQIMDLLLDLHDLGRTILVITHDPSVARVADRTYSITDGTVT
jgi:putative ABC transport system ATP-binding protein